MVILIYKFQYNLPNMMNSNQCYLLALRNLEQYILLKILASKHKFEQHVKIKIINDIEYLFDTPVEVKVEHKKIPEWDVYILNKILLSGISSKKVQGDNQFKTGWSLIDFNEKLFRSPSRQSLLIIHSYYKFDRGEIETYLFEQEEKFEILRIQKISNLQVNERYEDCFIIQDKKVEKGEGLFYFNCRRLVRLKEFIVINLHIFYSLCLKLCSEIITKQKFCSEKLADLIEPLKINKKIAEKSIEGIDFQYWAKVNDQMVFYLKIKSFKDKAISQVVQSFYKQGLGKCLNWQQHVSKHPTVDFNEVEQLIRIINYRNEDDIARLNLIVKSKDKEKSSIASGTIVNSQYQLTQPNYLEIIKDRLVSKEYDILSLTSIWPEASQLFQHIIIHWKMYEYSDKQNIKIIAKLLKYRLTKFCIKIKKQKENHFNLYEYLYPKAQFFMKKLTSLINPKQKQIQENLNFDSILKQVGIIHKGKSSQSIVDKIMGDFLTQVESIASGNGEFYVQTQKFEFKKPLKEFISQIIDHQHNAFYWEDVYNLITINARKIIGLKNYPYQSIKSSEAQCLGCTSSYLLNSNITNSNNTTPICLFREGPIEAIKNNILNQICNMLNNNGGIILFNCAKEYCGIVPKGAYLPQQYRQYLLQQISNILPLLSPQPAINQQIFISFVPIVILKESIAHKEELVHFKDIYVLRIKVCEPNPQFIYRITDHQNNINNRPMWTQVISKKKRNAFTPLTFANTLNHQCRKVGQIQNKECNFSTIFPHMSLVFVKKEYNDNLNKSLFQKGLNCFIESKFQRYNFALSKHISILYHRDRFEIIQKYLQNVKYEQRRVWPVFIFPYLQITKMESSDLKNAQKWLKQQFSQENLKLFELSRQVGSSNEYVIQYFLKTQSKLSTVFMYHVLCHFKVKTSFKNPDARSLKLIPLDQNSQTTLQCIMDQASSPLLLKCSTEQSEKTFIEDEIKEEYIHFQSFNLH